MGKNHTTLQPYNPKPNNPTTLQPYNPKPSDEGGGEGGEV